MEPEVSQEEVCPQKVYNPYPRTWVGPREDLAKEIRGKNRRDAIPSVGAAGVLCTLEQASRGK